MKLFSKVIRALALQSSLLTSYSYAKDVHKDTALDDAAPNAQRQLRGGQQGTLRRGGSVRNETDHILQIEEEFGMDPLNNKVYVESSITAKEHRSLSKFEWASITFKNFRNIELCLDLKNGNAVNGNPVQLWKCNGSKAQEWFVDSMGRIHSNVHGTDKCLEGGKQGKLYNKLFVWDCHNGLHQRWFLEEKGGQAHNKVRNQAFPAKVIGVSGGCHGVSSGKALEFHDDFSSWNCQRQQQWHYVTPWDSSHHNLALKFAPQMRFDRKASQFPLPASDYWQMSYTSNYERVLPSGASYHSSFNPDKMGLSYTVTDCGNQVKITYWALYKGQQPCTSGFWGTYGDHWGDWERVVVELTPDKNSIASVRFHQHGGWYTRTPGSFEVFGRTHVVAYVGKNSNGQYHDDGGSGGCLYWEDFRNTGSSGKIWNSWQRGKLLSTNNNQPWNTFVGNWGYDGVQGPNPKQSQDGGVCFSAHCDDSGCSKSLKK